MMGVQQAAAAEPSVQRVSVAPFAEAPVLRPVGERPAGHGLGSRQLRFSPIGTTNYIAPEVLSRKMAHSYEVDLWSLGVIAFELLFGYQPFKDPNSKMLTF